MKFTNHNWSDNYSFDSQDIQNIQKKLIKYQIIELITNEDVLKVLIEFNYWKRFCLIEIFAIFNKPIIQVLQKDMSTGQPLSKHNTFQTKIIFVIFMLKLLLLLHCIIFVLLCFVYYFSNSFYYF